MAYSQKRPAGGRARGDKDAPNGSGGGRSHNSGGDGSQGRGSGSDRPSAARPRGMSDASYLREPSEAGGSGPRPTGFSVGNSMYINHI